MSGGRAADRLESLRSRWRHLAGSPAWSGTTRELNPIAVLLTTLGAVFLVASELAPWVSLRTEFPNGYGPLPGHVTVTGEVSLDRLLAHTQGTAYRLLWTLLLMLLALALTGPQHLRKPIAVAGFGVSAGLVLLLVQMVHAARFAYLDNPPATGGDPFATARNVDIVVTSGFYCGAAALIFLVGALAWAPRPRTTERAVMGMPSPLPPGETVITVAVADASSLTRSDIRRYGDRASADDVDAPDRDQPMG